MADENSRYNLIVQLIINEVTADGPQKQFSDVLLSQYDLKYEDMNDMQWDIVQAVSGGLKPVSDAQAEEIKGKRKPK